MTQDELNSALKNGQVASLAPQDLPVSAIPEFDEMAKFYPLLELLRKPKSYLIAAPTFTPKTLLEQIQFYDDGIARRLYLYVNKTWRYTTLT